MNRFESENALFSSSDAMDSKSKSKKRSLGRIPAKLKKYYSTSKSIDSSVSINSKLHKLRPSELSRASMINPDIYPMIIEPDTKALSTVGGSGAPLFQASPTVIIFQDYAPFAEHEKRLYFRNNDFVARRIKIVQPDSPFFEVSAAKTPTGDALVSSKVAAGIEICFVVRFKPKDVRDYSWDLVCVTERESFVIPIRAFGLKPHVTFPDDIDFGSSTVGVETRKVLLLKNTGNATAKFTLRSLDEATFVCSKEEQVIEPEASITVEVLFTPRAARNYQSDIRVDFSKGPPCYIAVAGNGHNVNVSISCSQITMDPTYISLHSQRTLKIVNRSDIPIEFSWKSFEGVAEEESERSRMILELDRMEAQEMEDLRGSIALTDDEGSPNILNVNQNDTAFELVAMEAEITRKYRNLRLSLHNDQLLFIDNVFGVSPLSGQVWAQSEIEVIATFRPDTACQFEALAYLQVSGREDRMSLRLSGIGVGAYAVLSFDILDIGDVFVNTEYLYEVVIRNKGDIPAEWTYVASETHIGSKFDLVPREGILAVGESKTISIRFECDLLGDIFEPIRFSLQGNEDPLTCRIKGSVIGPTFHFDCLKIDYGIVSFDYLHQTSVRLVNTSNISMVFSLHVPQDGSDLKKEFDISPSEGTLGPGEGMDISVDFIPTSAKVYEYSLDVDVLGVGESLYKVPILAECVVGGIKLTQKELSFGESFIRHPYDRVLTIANTSDAVYTKYEILPQLQYTTSIAVYKPEAPTGFIEPGKSVDVSIQLVAQKIGSFRIALAVAVVGSKEPPTQISISCVSVGPRLRLDKSELRWGSINCLTDSVKSITIGNDSLIDASVKMFMRLARSKFVLSAHEKLLKPDESYKLDITCNLDDSITHKDELYIVVEEGEHLMVPVSATGVGTTMFSVERLDIIDLGVQLSNSTFEKKFMLENRGRRQQQLHWYNKSFKDMLAAKMAISQSTSRDSGMKTLKKAGQLEPKFTIEPSDITLRPNTATMFTVRGFSATPGTIRETLVLESIVGKERTPKDIIVTEVVCLVVNPLVEFSSKNLEFEYFWRKGDDTKSSSKTVSITNKSALTLNFVLRTETPFNLSSFEHIIAPEQKVDVTIDFYPLYRDDRLSHVVNSALTVAYRGHSQRDTVALKGVIQFPNLVFDKKAVDFGCVLNDAIKYVVVKVTNTSSLEAAFEWNIQENTLGKSVRISKAKTFDILPFRCSLAAGQTDEVRFSMVGISDQKVNATAVCVVEGGPEYRLPVVGEASSISYRLDASFIDFDRVLFNESGEREFVIFNTGKVAFPFEVDYSELSSHGIVEASPKSGRVPAGDKQKVTVRIRPVIPHTLSETLILKIAHFEPISFKCFCKAIFPCVYVNLPRYKLLGPFGESGDVQYLMDRWEAINDEASANVRSEQMLASTGESFTLPDPPKASTADLPEMIESALSEMHLSPIKKADSALKVVTVSHDTEIQRLAFCHHLQNALKAAALDECTSFQEYLSSTLDLKKIVCGTYVMDFGNVICGQVKKKSFKVTNAAETGLLSWTFEHRHLTGTGFTIDPEKISKLSELASVDLVVRFNAGKKVGRREVTLPLELRNSPTINLILAANVCLPEISLSSESISFEKLSVGYSQKYYVRLTNVSHVPADWSMQIGGKDALRFSVDPPKGSLLGGRSALACVEFIPHDSKRYAAEITLHVETNPKSKSLKVAGEGYAPTVRFDPPSVEVGPMLPFAKGLDQLVTILNEGDVALEIFSLDFDSQYKVDEEKLLLLDSYDADGLLRWDSSSAFYTDAFMNQNSVSAQSLSETPPGLPLPPVRVSSAPRDTNDHQDYLVMGPPLSGVTSISHRLARSLHLPVRSIDEILTELSSVAGPMGAEARRVLGISTEEETADLQRMVERLTAEANESKTLAAETYKKTLKGKMKDKEVPVDILQTPQVLALDEILRNARLHERNLAKFISFRLSWEDAGFGFIFDGVSSNKCSSTTVLTAFKTVLTEPSVVVLNPPGEKQGFTSRVRSLYKSTCREEEFLRKAFERTFIVARKPPPTLNKTRKSHPVKTLESSDVFTAEAVDLDTVPIVPPVGDEPWFDISTGVIAELDTLEYRALDIENRAKYLAQYRSQLKTQLTAARDLIARISIVYDPIEDRLLQGSPDGVDSDGFVFFYETYRAEAYPLALSQFSTAPSGEQSDSGEVDQSAGLDQTAGLTNPKFIDMECGPGVDETLQSLMLSLPLPKISAPDPEAIPAPKVFQLIRKPVSRQVLHPPSNFKIIDINESIIAPEIVPQSKTKEKPKSADKTKRIAVEEVHEPPPATSRWIIAPGAKVNFRVRFRSDVTGSFRDVLRFEANGTGQSFLLHCSGSCDIPRVSDDPRNVFMKRMKHLPLGNAHPSRRFVISEGYYSFGPLAVYKRAEGREDSSASQQYSLNSDVIRLTNTGKFPCHVELRFEELSEELKGVFILEGGSFDLDEGESKDVTIWAFPVQPQLYTTNLLVCVQNNPSPIVFKMQCVGVTPTVEFEGPWKESIDSLQDQIANCKDKKLIKDLELRLNAVKEYFFIDFARVLVSSRDTRSIVIKNTSLLPLLWELDRGELETFEDVVFSPTGGVLGYGESVSVSISFQSKNSVSITGKFEVKYADAEQGMLIPARTKTAKFRLAAESYTIQTIALNADDRELSADGIDFGNMRVGDIAVQVVKIMNKGRYKIGFKIIYKRPSIGAVVRIEPDSGVVDPGPSATELKITFCCKDKETLLKRSRDVRVQILEPLSGKVVEEFPLTISANAKYTRFRLQPSRGVNFGATRYDADIKSKRVEISNEGAFEFTYVICPAVAETDELDILDRSAFLYYAYNTPAALRNSLLGENYLERLYPGGVKAAKKEGKGASKKEKEVQFSTSKGLVIDPDQITLEAAPEDSLKVGFFTISSRVGLVQPGQTAGFEIAYDPQGSGISREKLRICITGVDPSDNVTRSLQDFEIAGESCFPSITTDDFNSIFEEQEIVPSLALIEGKLDSGIGKLPIGKVVFAELERALVFGPVLCGQAGGKGLTERIRITNPTKIDVKVKLRLDPRSAVAEPQKKSKETKKAPAIAPPEAFFLSSPLLEIPPHEHRFVNVNFNPTEMKQYRAVFVAEVDPGSGVQASKGSKPGAVAFKKGDDLTFEVIGLGTLPSVAIDFPLNRLADGRTLIDFHRVHVGRQRQERFVLRNSGVTPATCLFDITGATGVFIFPYKNASTVIQPGESESIVVSFCPKDSDAAGNFEASIKVTVLNNQFDTYAILLRGSSYKCDALITASADQSDTVFSHEEDVVEFPQINLAQELRQSELSVAIASNCASAVRYSFSVSHAHEGVISVEPSNGHLMPNTSQDIYLRFTPTSTMRLERVVVTCKVQRIRYTLSESMMNWNCAMKSIRPATSEDLEKLEAYATALKDYEEKASKLKKGKSAGAPPTPCNLELVSNTGDSVQPAMVYEVIPEPQFEVIPSDTVKDIQIFCNGVADYAKYSCEGKDSNIPFAPTFMFQSTSHKITFQNECLLNLPVKWVLEEFKRRGGARLGTAQILSRGGSRQLLGTGLSSSSLGPSPPNPFTVTPAQCVVPAKSSADFFLRFSPVEVDDFVYLLKGETLRQAEDSLSAVAEEAGQFQELQSSNSSSIRIVLRGTAKRPVCHFEMQESSDYLSRRPAGMKNEQGLYAPIESDVKLVSISSIGLRSRNTYRFHVLNPTSESFDFIWEAMGDPSPYWRCVYGSGTLFSGKRAEMVFEFLPEDVSVAEAFFKFRLPNAQLEQLFLFSGSVSEPKVSLSLSRVNFQSVMLGGEGGSETIYIENQEHIPFNFTFDKSTLPQLEGTSGPVLSVLPYSGTVPPTGKLPLRIIFRPQEEVHYNFNLLCEVKRKPTKLNLNVKGEGYAVHSVLQMEQSIEEGDPRESNLKSLRAAPAVNTLDFGTVKLRESTIRKLLVKNTGKFNFEYSWDTGFIGSSITVSGAPLGGTLKKGEELSYQIAFTPTREEEIQNLVMTFTIAGKYAYRILARGIGIEPALRFSFMTYDFGSCFITAPGGGLVSEDVTLSLFNQDPSSNIAIECIYQKTASLLVDCPPAVINAGSTLDVPIRFTPRENKEYIFVVPFLINGSTKVAVNVRGRGIHARVELAIPGQRRINLGSVNVGSEVVKTIPIINRSSKSVTFKLLEDENSLGFLSSKCFSLTHMNELSLGPKSTTNVTLSFAPNRRLPLFSDDICIHFAGMTKKFITVSGKAQGTEVVLETDSLPFGTAVQGSHKIKKLRLENVGDVPVSYQWVAETFGPHFTVSPMAGKLSNGGSVSFDVEFRPAFIDSDIRQEAMTLDISGMSSLKLTCSGSCISQPADAIQTLTFQTAVRTLETKSVRISNSSEKDWYLSPAVHGDHWSVPGEIKVPARGSVELVVSYFPLVMAQRAVNEGEQDSPLRGQVFIALPSGSALLYNLIGYASAPTRAGLISAETAAKRPVALQFPLKNWLGMTQKFTVSVQINEKPSPAVFFTAANAIEVPPHGAKDYAMR